MDSTSSSDSNRPNILYRLLGLKQTQWTLMNPRTQTDSSGLRRTSVLNFIPLGRLTIFYENATYPDFDELDARFSHFPPAVDA
jgi:hypothetical protein